MALVTEIEITNLRGSEDRRIFNTAAVLKTSVFLRARVDARVEQVLPARLATKAEDALGFLVAFHATLALTKELVSIATSHREQQKQNSSTHFQSSAQLKPRLRTQPD